MPLPAAGRIIPELTAADAGRGSLSPASEASPAFSLLPSSPVDAASPVVAQAAPQPAQHKPSKLCEARRAVPAPKPAPKLVAKTAPKATKSAVVWCNWDDDFSDDSLVSDSDYSDYVPTPHVGRASDASTPYTGTSMPTPATDSDLSEAAILPTPFQVGGRSPVASFSTVSPAGAAAVHNSIMAATPAIDAGYANDPR